MTLPSGDVVHNPVRVSANGDGCDVVFTVHRRAGASPSEFEADAAAVAADLAALRSILEST